MMPAIRKCVVDIDLVSGELVLERLIFDAGEAQRPGSVKAHGLQVARDDLHRGNAPFVHRRHEGVPVGKGSARSPETETRSVAEIGGVGGAGRGQIEDAGTRKRVLEADAGQPLLGSLRRAELCLGAGGVGECMGLVDDDDAVEILAEPVEDLLEPGGFIMTLAA